MTQKATNETAIEDADAPVREIDIPVRDYRACMSFDRETAESALQDVWQDLYERGFTVLDETPLKTERMLPEMHDYAAAAQGLSQADIEPCMADSFNAHGFVVDTEMGVTRTGPVFLRPQPVGIARNPHIFRNADSPDMDAPLPGSTACMDRASDASISVNRTVMRAVALGMDQPMGWFDACVDEYPATDIRLFMTAPSSQSLILNPHFDYGFTTETHSLTPGLQFKIDDNAYAPVFSGGGSIVVAVGMLLEALTDGKLKARRHRVYVEDPEIFRSSIVMFQVGSATAKLPFINAPHNRYLREHPSLAEITAAEASFYFWELHNRTEMGASIAFDPQVIKRIRGAS